MSIRKNMRCYVVCSICNVNQLILSLECLIRNDFMNFNSKFQRDVIVRKLRTSRCKQVDRIKKLRQPVCVLIEAEDEKKDEEKVMEEEAVEEEWDEEVMVEVKEEKKEEEKVMEEEVVEEGEEEVVMVEVEQEEKDEEKVMEEEMEEEEEEEEDKEDEENKVRVEFITCEDS